MHPQNCPQCIPYRPVQDQIGDLIETSLLQVQNHQSASVPLRQLWKSRGGIDDERRTDGDEQIGLQRFTFGALHFVQWHRLPKRYRRRLYPTAASAMRNDPVLLEIDAQRLDLEAGATIQTMRIRRVAMQFDHLFVRNTGILMQAID